jgi:hypothetical protein
VLNNIIIGVGKTSRPQAVLKRPAAATAVCTELAKRGKGSQQGLRQYQTTSPFALASRSMPRSTA